MKRSVSLFLAIVMLLSLCTFSVSATEVERKVGTLYISKINGIWVSPDNQMILLTPGQSNASLYAHKLNAVYDEAKGGYVVTEKHPAHHAFQNNVVPENGIGLSFLYNPAEATGREFAWQSWETWCNIRVGDVLRLNNVDLTTNKIITNAPWGDPDFQSESTVSVTTTRAPLAQTAYSDKTIVAFGDSVTVNGGWTETVGDNIGAYIINSGVGGNTVSSGKSVFDRDVRSKNPDIVIIMFGVNDYISIKWQTPTVYKNTLKYFYDECSKMGAKVIFMFPNDINREVYNDERFSAYEGGIDEAIELYKSLMMEVATETGAGFISILDGWKGLTATDYLMDTVHPTKEGYDITVKLVSEFLKEHEEEYAGKRQFLIKNFDNLFMRDGCVFLNGCTLTAEELSAAFTSNVEVYGKDGVKLGASDKAYTGCILKNLFDDGTYAETKLVVSGDINADGLVDGADCLLLKQHLSNREEISDDLCKTAADLSENGSLSTIDYIRLKIRIKNF